MYRNPSLSLGRYNRAAATSAVGDDSIVVVTITTVSAVRL
jgi:hypothetical protein